MGAFIDLTGKKFGRATVLRKAGKDKNGLLLWECQCDCGKIYTTRGQDLRRGKSTNCGCRHLEVLQERNHKHGMTGTRPYRIWKAMHTRCYNPNSPSYLNYGGRGIQMCSAWRDSFSAFWRDMQSGYADNLEIDRIDHDGDYCPENCRWADDKTQNRNKRNNHRVKTHLGELPLAVIAEATGTPYDTVKRRANRGWSGDELLRGERKA